MKTATVFDEFHSKTKVIYPAATTANKADKTENFSPVNIAKSDLDECTSIGAPNSFKNIDHIATNTIMLEKIPKIETDEQNFWSDYESNDDLDRDPFADVKCDPNFVLCANPSSYLKVQQQEPQKSTETNLTTTCHSPKTSKHIRPTPTPTTTNVQNNSQFQFDCKLCLAKLGSQDDLKSHVRLCSTIHKDRHLFCVHCNIKYTSSYGFRRHNLKVHRRDVEAIKPEHYRVQLKCQFCPSMFVLREKFKIHTESHVKNLNLDTATTARNDANLQLKLNPYKCQECGSTFSTVMSLSDHVLAKHVDHIFKCPETKCEKIFSTKGKLNQHFNIHSDERPFKCPEPNCGKWFKWKHSMKGHISCHFNTNLFICLEPNCSSKFRTEDNLAKHVELHKSGDIVQHRKKELFKCPRADCKKTFKHKRSINAHVKELHGSRGEEDSFKCPHPGCKFTCKRKNYIKVHMRTHTGERPFKCTD